MFFAFMSRLRFIERWSTMRKTRRENVLEHTAQVAMIVHALALLGNERHGKTYDRPTGGVPQVLGGAEFR